MVAIGVIGAGRIAERHLHALKRREDVTLSIFDVNEELAETRARHFDLEHAKTLEAILRDDSIEAVDVCVPTPLHYELVTAALKHGKHVFCEKPLCETTAQAEQIRQLAADTRRTVMVGYLYRFYPAFQLVREVVGDGAIGRTHLALFRVGGRGGAVDWKHNSSEGGGAILEMLVHLVDLAIWLLGPLQDARLLLKETLLKEREVGGRMIAADAEDCVIATAMAGATRVILQSDLATPSYMNVVELQGENGSIFSSMLHYLPTLVYCKTPRGIYNQGNNTYTFPMVDVFERELHQFVDVLQGRHSVEHSVEDSIAVMSVIDRLRQQAPAGSEV